MQKQVIKRNGDLVIYNPSKILVAIAKALDSVGNSDFSKADAITQDVLAELDCVYFNKSKKPFIEDIQDIVEKQLILHDLSEAAKSYILYRDLHRRIRNVNTLFDSADWINSYIKGTNSKIHSDSLIDFSLDGMYKKISQHLSELYWMNEVYPSEIRTLHFNKDIHIHKSSTLSAYCVGWDMEDLLLSGIQGVDANVCSGPAKHFSSALLQLVNFFYILTTETPDGAIAMSGVDTYLAPFIQYDKLSYKQVKQCLQEFIYNMNVPTKSGAQVVFSNITLDLRCPDYMKDKSVIIGGKAQSKKYGEFQREINVFNKALVEVYCEGDFRERAFTWPIPTYNITKDFEWVNPNYKGVWEMSAKYGIPYFANFVNSDMSPDDARSMCCRLRIDKRELKKRGGGFFGANPLTGSIGYVTINLPRVGYIYKGNRKGFFERLEYLMVKANESLCLRRELIEDLTEKGLYPYSKYYLRAVKERTGKYWSNHFNTMGPLGINEASLNFQNKDIGTEQGQDFAKEILDFMNERLLRFQEDSGEIYNLEAIPAEGACYEIAKKDKELYPDIVVANNVAVGGGAEPYYTNSSHLPVGFTDDLFEALDLQDELQSKYTGGTVFHVFLGERLNSAESTKLLVKKIATNYSLPYFTLSPTFSICANHGYIKGECFECSECGKECKVFSRVVGKLTPVQRWNQGKREEFKDRKIYRI